VLLVKTKVMNAKRFTYDFVQQVVSFELIFSNKIFNHA